MPNMAGSRRCGDLQGGPRAKILMCSAWAASAGGRAIQGAPRTSWSSLSTLPRAGAVQRLMTRRGGPEPLHLALSLRQPHHLHGAPRFSWPGARPGRPSRSRSCSADSTPSGSRRAMATSRSPSWPTPRARARGSAPERAVRVPAGRDAPLQAVDLLSTGSNASRRGAAAEVRARAALGRLAVGTPPRSARRILRRRLGPRIPPRVAPAQAPRACASIPRAGRADESSGGAGGRRNRLEALVGSQIGPS